MKKLFSLLAIALVATVSMNAQSTKLIAKTVTGVDTIYFQNVPSNIMSFQTTFTKTGGTVSGKLILEGTIEGTYVGIDSLTLADNANKQTLKTNLTSTNFLSYRVRYTSASAATLRSAYLRRLDEKR